MRNIRQNLVLSFAYNVAGIPLAAGVLYPLFGLLLSPVVAAAAMALSSVSVIANALHLRTAKVERHRSARKRTTMEGPVECSSDLPACVMGTVLTGMSARTASGAG